MSPEGHAGGPIEVGEKRLVYGIGLALSVVAFAVGLWVFAQLGAFPPVALALAMFAGGAATFAWLLATGPYVFRIDAHGLHDRSGPLAAGRVAWDELASVRSVVSQGRAQVGLVLTDAARERRGLVARGAIEALRRELGVDHVIPPEAISEGTGEEIAARLERWRADPGAREELGAATLDTSGRSRKAR